VPYDYALDHGIIRCLPKKVKYTDTYEGSTKKARESGSSRADEAQSRTKRRRTSTSAAETDATDSVPSQGPVMVDEERSRRKQESTQEFLRPLHSGVFERGTETTPMVTKPEVFRTLRRRNARTFEWPREVDHGRVGKGKFWLFHGSSTNCVNAKGST
jgi:hypothetical protein